ncbi:MAG: hypothetical protein AAGB97_08380 [Dehalococcoidia bacterium]|nr:hypothetical protein [Chloroflexota bacterium]MBT9162289.1 hypothetical protein [Chloroflexota bacterium]
MRRKCEVCGKEIEPFAEFWIREADQFDDQGIAINRGRSMPFCGFACIFGWSGAKLRSQKKASRG